MTPRQAEQLEKNAKQDLVCRKSGMYKLLAKGVDTKYEKWLAKEQKEARIVEDNL